MWNVLNEGNDGVSYITADATPYVPCAWFDSHSRAWRSLLLITQVSMISIFVTQFSIWYRSVFFQVKRKALKRKTQLIQVYFQLTLLHLLTKKVPKSSRFWSHFPSIMVNCPRQLHPTCPSKLPKLPQSHQKTLWIVRVWQPWVLLKN